MSIIKKALLLTAKPYLRKIAANAKEHLKRECDKFTIAISKDKTTVDFEGTQMDVDVSEHWSQMESIAKSLIDADEIIGFALKYDTKPVSFRTYYIKNNIKQTNEVDL